MKISTQSLEFPECIKEKLLKMINISKVDIEFVNGNNIIFEKTNLGLIQTIHFVLKVQVSKIQMILEQHKQDLMLLVELIILQSKNYAIDFNRV